MARTVRAVFDGQVLRPEEPVDLEPNTSYLLTIEPAAPGQAGAPSERYPLSEIARLATDMGVTDLSTRHGRYAHGQPVEDSDRT